MLLDSHSIIDYLLGGENKMGRKSLILLMIMSGICAIGFFIGSRILISFVLVLTIPTLYFIFTEDKTQPQKERER